MHGCLLRLIEAFHPKEFSLTYRCLTLLLASLVPIVVARPAAAQLASDIYISPSRPVPTGRAPGMQVKEIKHTADEQVYTVVFSKGDEVLSGLTDFTLQHKIEDAHFTAIGAIEMATLAWLEPAKQIYHRIPVNQQAEVLSLIGDVATFNGKPIVHMHAVLGRQDGSTVGGHVFELHVNPTLEVFMTVNAAPLKKKPDAASGMKLIDPTQ